MFQEACDAQAANRVASVHAPCPPLVGSYLLQLILNPSPNVLSFPRILRQVLPFPALIPWVRFSRSPTKCTALMS